MRLAEQFIEQVAEPPLEHLNLCLRDRNGAWPIVGDGPGGQVVFGRSTHRNTVSQQRLKLF